MPITSPTTSPVSVEEMKQHLRVDGNQDDATIGAYLVAAVEFIQNATCQQLLPGTGVITLDSFPGDTVTIRCLPLLSITSIQYIDPTGVLQTFTADAYRIDTASRPGRILLKPGQTWPATDNSPGCITINFTAGYANAEAVPSLLKHAVKFLAAAYFENREGVTDRPLSEVPFAVQAIVNQHSFPILNG